MRNLPIRVIAIQRCASRSRFRSASVCAEKTTGVADGEGLGVESPVAVPQMPRNKGPTTKQRQIGTRSETRRIVSANVETRNRAWLQFIEDCGSYLLVYRDFVYHRRFQ